MTPQNASGHLLAMPHNSTHSRRSENAKRQKSIWLCTVFALPLRT